MSLPRLVSGALRAGAGACLALVLAIVPAGAGKQDRLPPVSPDAAATDVAVTGSTGRPPVTDTRPPIDAIFRLVELSRPGNGEICYMQSGEKPILPGSLLGEGCPLKAPVEVDSFGPGGIVRMRQNVVLDCEFAKRFEEFIVNEMSDATLFQFGQRLKGLNAVGLPYCLREASLAVTAAGAVATGPAIEILEIQLDDDTVVSVAENWGAKSANGSFLMVVERKACTRFAEVFGPDGSEHAGLRLASPCDGEDCAEPACQ